MMASIEPRAARVSDSALRRHAYLCSRHRYLLTVCLRDRGRGLVLPATTGRWAALGANDTVGQSRQARGNPAPDTRCGHRYPAGAGVPSRMPTRARPRRAYPRRRRRTAGGRCNRRPFDPQGLPKSCACLGPRVLDQDLTPTHHDLSLSTGGHDTDSGAPRRPSTSPPKSPAWSKRYARRTCSSTGTNHDGSPESPFLSPPNPASRRCPCALGLSHGEQRDVLLATLLNDVHPAVQDERVVLAIGHPLGVQRDDVRAIVVVAADHRRSFKARRVSENSQRVRSSSGRARQDDRQPRRTSGRACNQPGWNPLR